MPETWFVGLDDTDTLETPGTNKLALYLCEQLSDMATAMLVTRHQLLEDPRVPCTNKNGCAAISFRSNSGFDLETFKQRLRGLIVNWCPVGSDPGLCVANEVSAERLQPFGELCKRTLLSQTQANDWATMADCHLEGLGGTNDGIIGALSAVGLQCGGNDGRVIYAGPQRRDLCDLTGIWTTDDLIARGIAAIRLLEDNSPVDSGRVDLGKRLRANYRDHQLVLFVERNLDASADWNAVRVA